MLLEIFAVLESLRTVLLAHSISSVADRTARDSLAPIAPVFRERPTYPFLGSSIPPRRFVPSSKTNPSQKSSRRRLNSVSVSNSRQEATPASAEVGPSTSSTPSVSLRGDAESAEVPSSLSGQTTMDTHGINKRRDRSPYETSDGRADVSRGNPSSDRGNHSNSVAIEETTLIKDPQ